MKYPESDHYKDGVFLNPGVRVTKSFWELLKWQSTRKARPWPVTRENVKKPELANALGEKQISTTFINHATHLIQIQNLNVLTDPVFSERVSPLTWAGPKRMRKPGLEIDELPKIDVIVISHNHYDHMDKVSIRKLSEKFDPLFVVPLGNKVLIEEFGGKRVVELDWWDSTDIGAGARVTLVPAQHWSKRAAFDTNKALWGGFVIATKAAKKIYFSGDTGYGAFFREIRERLGVMDLSIIAIGAYEPRWFMKSQHMNPDEAVQAHVDLESRRTLGTHFGTFQLTDEGIDEPAEALEIALKKFKILPGVFTAPDNGETLFID